MSLINTKVQPFSAKAFHRNDFIDITEQTLAGRWSVLFFYPADFTFVCPTELQELAEHYEEFQKMNVDVYSISTDTHFTHKAWHDYSPSIKDVQFPMIGDPTGVLARQFDVMIEEEGLAQRGTFIINPEGIIKAYEIHDNGIGRDTGELIRKIQAAQFIAENPGFVCPAKWKRSEKAMQPSLNLVGKI